MAQKKQAQDQETPDTRPNDVRVLSPQPVLWEIGERVFEQTPLQIDRLGDVFEEIVDIVVGGGLAGVLDQLMDIQSADIMPVLARVVAGVPKKLPKIVALALDMPKDEKFIRTHVRARQAVQIIRTFVVQNEVAALLQDFFELAQELRTGVEEVTADLQETLPETEEEEESPSES